MRVCIRTLDAYSAPPRQGYAHLIVTAHVIGEIRDGSPQHGRGDRDAGHHRRLAILVAMASKPRYLTSGKDMIWSIIPLLIVCAFVAMASGNCSVGLTGSASDDKRPAFDVADALKSDAQTMPFPIRLPPDPAGWKPNSGSRGSVSGHVTSNVGWLTAAGSYLQLTQTDAGVDALADSLGGDNVSSDTATRDIGGHRWTTFRTYEDNKFWITDLGDVRIAVMSKGSDDAMAAMAASVLAQQPLSRADGPEVLTAVPSG